MNKTKNIYNFLTTFFCGILCAILIFFLFTKTTNFSTARKFCDSTFITSLIFFWVSVINLISKNGLLDGVTYSFRKFFKKDNMSYTEYVENKKRPEGSKINFTATGIIFFIESVLSSMILF